VGDEKRNRNREPTPHSSWEPHSAYRFHQEQLTYRDHEHPAPAGDHLPPNNTLRHQARRCAPSCAPPVAEWGSGPYPAAARPPRQLLTPLTPLTASPRALRLLVSDW
jgi:hypothetical protein